MVLRPLTDKDIRAVLVRIDLKEGIELTTIDAEFLDSEVYNLRGEWSVKQRGIAAQIAERYRHRL